MVTSRGRIEKAKLSVHCIWPFLGNQRIPWCEYQTKYIGRPHWQNSYAYSDKELETIVSFVEYESAVTMGFCTSHTHSRVEGCTFTKLNPPYDRTEKANMELLAANFLSKQRADQGTDINGAMPKIGDNRQSTLQAFPANIGWYGD